MKRFWKVLPKPRGVVSSEKTRERGIHRLSLRSSLAGACRAGERKCLRRASRERYYSLLTTHHSLSFPIFLTGVCAFCYGRSLELGRFDGGKEALLGERTRLGLWTFGAALVLGGLGDVLLRGVPWGINVLLLVAALVVLAAAPVFMGWVHAGSGGRWMVPVALVLAASVAWRASPVLASLNVVGSLAALSLAAIWSRSGRIWSRGVSDYAAGLLYTGAFAAAGPLPVMVRDVEWGEVARGGWRSPALAVSRGLFIAVPLVLVFGGLLVAADAVFEDLVLRVFDFDVAQVFGHSALILFLAWVSAGFLGVALAREDAPNLSAPRPGFLSLGIVELGVVLGSLNALFLAFVVVQAGYLFGGRLAAGLTYAEYARRGFFELVAVAALVLPLLLVAHWLLRAEGRRGRLVFNVLAASMVGLVGVIMASALWRMNLYYDRYGLTELRLYTTVFMLWLGAILALFLATVLPDRRERFGSWTLVASFAAILLLNAVNPDAIIARANIERLEEGERFDPQYLSSLSEDAAPIISDALPEIGDQPLWEETLPTPSGEEREVEGPTLKEEVISRWRGDPDWRTWNFSRATAHNLAASVATGSSE